MAKLSITERIAQLEVRKQALKARLTKHERAVDTRRKVLLGALLLDAVERGRSGQGRAEDRAFAGTLADWLRRELPGFLTRPIDRTLFPEFIDQIAVPAGATPLSPEASGTSPGVAETAGLHDDASRAGNM